ncbi:hypothetical protein [Chamaesiphon sp. VAR_69_metabat_338]|uniref:hypothetical protein n=1 Tax=Chamaesiphon sp. VAR_69_metabat_338 TaxID=2964704 RepID=UPI00286D7BAB|nr:hypothetical protein [Chamaesiphon sp. VAR_69_metabat_338]
MAYWLTIELELGEIAPLPAAMDTQSEGLVYGTTVPQILTQLDRIGHKLGIDKLDNFIYKDTTGFRRLLDEAESEGNAVLASAMRAEIATVADRPRWHEPSQARQTVRSLKEFVATNQDTLPGKDPQATAKWTLWDLEAYDLILSDLEERGLKFAFVERN